MLAVIQGERNKMTTTRHTDGTNHTKLIQTEADIVSHRKMDRWTDMLAEIPRDRKNTILNNANKTSI